jgi:hypothetical protein
MAIKIGKDGSITRDGKTYKNKAAYKNRDKSKEGAKSSFFSKILEGSKSKKAKAAKASVAQGKRNQAATSKMYAAESMFTSAKNRDVAKTTPGKARPFGDAKASAEKSGKDQFLYKGKSYFTTKGAADNRDNKKTRFAPKGTFPKKSNLDAKTVASFKKRIRDMKERKSKGKNFSAKNLKELEAKLAAN